MKALILVARCLERKQGLPVFASQVRFRGKLERKREANPVKEKVFSKRKRLLPNAAEESKVAYLADKPLDDVWISKYYPEPKFSFKDIIKRHQEYAQPPMHNTLHCRVYADMDINMRTKKQTKFLSRLKNTIEVPHPFQTGVKQNVIFLCKEKKDVTLALELGATRAGGLELVKMIKDGVIKKTDFDHICATPDILQEVNSLRGALREECPDMRNGKISEDIAKLLKFYLHGLTYEAAKISDNLGKLQVPIGTLDMSFEWLLDNFNCLIDSINKQKPAGAPGQFINNLSIIAPPSPERFILKLEEYSPTTGKQKQESAVIADEIDNESDDEDEEISKKKKKKQS